MAEREEAVCPGQRALTRAVIKNLYKLMAYKDEYEVARLHLRAGWRDEIARTFKAPVRVSYRLHPPLLRSLGLRRKLAFGPWFSRVFAVLRRLKGAPRDAPGSFRVRSGPAGRAGANIVVSGGNYRRTRPSDAA